MSNTRFATAIHILTLLAAQPNEWLRSDYIAGSISLNPVVVRKELSVLNHAGLVVSRKGKDGGVQLSKPSDKILLADIFTAIKHADLMGKKNPSPNPACPIGNAINDKLNTLFAEIDQVVVSKLSQKSLSDFVNQFS